MYRFLLTPRWWAINLFAILAIPVCLVAGSWQLARFEDRVDSHREQRELATDPTGTPSPLADLLPLTGDTVGEQAEITGTYDVARQFLVPGRPLDGDNGYYVLTPLRPADGGPAVPVVRGWLPGEPDGETARSVPEPAAGRITVVGAVQAPESASEVGGELTGLPTGQLGVIGPAALINVLPYDVADAWITVRDAEDPMTPVPATAPSGTGLDMDAFQNLGYTAEWFVFAAFTVFMWYRLFRREVEAQRDAALGLPLTETVPAQAAGPPSPPAGAGARSGSPAPPA